LAPYGAPSASCGHFGATLGLASANRHRSCGTHSSQPPPTPNETVFAENEIIRRILQLTLPPNVAQTAYQPFSWVRSWRPPPEVPRARLKPKSRAVTVEWERSLSQTWACEVISPISCHHQSLWRGGCVCRICAMISKIAFWSLRCVLSCREPQVLDLWIGCFWICHYGQKTTPPNLCKFPTVAAISAGGAPSLGGKTSPQAPNHPIFLQKSA
jgi:hypothetical protein